MGTRGGYEAPIENDALLQHLYEKSDKGLRIVAIGNVWWGRRRF